MKNITRDVILDLLPVYLSGEASEDTKKLVEEYARHDEEIARIIETGEIPVDEPVVDSIHSEELEKKTLMKIRKNMRRQMAIVAMVTAGILMIPFIAMQFTSEVNWSPGDFIIMGILLTAAGGGYVLLSGLSGNRSYKIASGIAILTAFLIVWVNLAVGIIGSESHPANTLYFILIVIAILFVFIFKARPEPMHRLMMVIGLLNFCIPIVAWFIWGRWTVQFSQTLLVIAFNSIFSLLFFVSAYLYKKAVQKR